MHREAERVLELYRTGKAGTYGDPGTSAQLILEYIVRVSGWILEEPDPSAYRACYSRYRQTASAGLDGDCGEE